MTDDRFNDLLGRWLDDGLDPADEDELLAAAHVDTERKLRLLREHRRRGIWRHHLELRKAV